MPAALEAAIAAAFAAPLIRCISDCVPNPPTQLMAASAPGSSLSYVLGSRALPRAHSTSCVQGSLERGGVPEGNNMGTAQKEHIILMLNCHHIARTVVTDGVKVAVLVHVKPRLVTPGGGGGAVTALLALVLAAVAVTHCKSEWVHRGGNRNERMFTTVCTWG